MTDTTVDAAATTEGTTNTTLVTDPAANQQTAAADAPGEQGTTEAAESTETTEGEAQGAPESYEDFTSEDGVTPDPENVESFKAMAKEMNLSQTQAQQLYDMGVKLTKQVGDAQQAAHAEALTQWAQAARTDKEFGGEKFDANLGVGKAALDKLGTPELQTLLNESGLGNHPEVIRLLYKAGRALGDDNFVPGGRTGPAAGSTPDQRLASALYPTQ